MASSVIISFAYSPAVDEIGIEHGLLVLDPVVGQAVIGGRRRVVVGTLDHHNVRINSGNSGAAAAECQGDNG